MKKLIQIITVILFSLSMITVTTVAQDKNPSKKSCCEKSLECKSKPYHDTKSTKTKSEDKKQEDNTKKSETKKEIKTK